MTGGELAPFIGPAIIGATTSLTMLFAWITARRMARGWDLHDPISEDPEIPPDPVKKSDNNKPTTVQDLPASEVHAHIEALFQKFRDINYRLPPAIREMVAHVQFTGRQVLVGHKKTGSIVTGMEVEEVPWVANGSTTRPIRDASEMHRLAPTEMSLPPALRRGRVASGEALVRVNVQQTPVAEDVIEPIYRTEVRVLYILLDVSPSMWNTEGAWRIPLWQGIMIRLIEKARDAEVPCIIREFSGDVGHPLTINSWREAMRYYQTLFGTKVGSGTNIGAAIRAAIHDFRASGNYDQADIVIVTDGGDHAGMNPTVIRNVMDDAKIRLHAIMVGIENPGLMEAADVYQVIDNTYNVHEPVLRVSS